MQISKVNFERFSALSHKDITYQNEPEKLDSFIVDLPTQEGIDNAINRRKLFPVDRAILVSVLLEAYHNKASVEQFQNINELLKDDTYTIVTAHQPCLLGGPAFYIYKICSVINLTKSLSAKYPEKKFVPVFITGSEDHDFDEVSSVKLFNQTITWDTTQTGSVGRFTTDGLDKVIDALSTLLGNNDKAKQLINTFNDALKSASNYNDFVFDWINKIFGAHGLLVINMDHKTLKNQFDPIIKKEIFETSSVELVNKTQERLHSELGFKPQAHAREINFFYLSQGRRDRIELIDGRYVIHDTTISFSKDELEKEIENHADRFSPNVVIRPLYQEYILPNIAYIGGGGEIAYWLERKQQFEHFGVFFPVLIRRNSVMMIPKNIQKTMEKLNLSIDDIIIDEAELIKTYVSRHGGDNLDVQHEFKQLQDVFDKLSEKAKSIDATLVPYVMAESVKSIKSVEQIEGRLRKTIKQREETQVNQLINLKSKLFPNGGLQERQDSFWSFYVNEEEDLITKLIIELNPLDRSFLFLNL